MARSTIRSLNDRKLSGRNLIPTWSFTLERVTGIEPALSAWEADVLPLNYTRATADPRPVHRTSRMPALVRHDMLPEPVGCQRAALRPRHQGPG
jgi:hypothetical protein